LLSAVEKLREIDISFRSITEPFDTANPLGNFMISLLGSVAQLERDTFMGRAKMGILRRVKEGHCMVGTPLYRYIYNKETKKLEINPRESKIVKLIYDLYQEENSSEAQVIKKLNNMGIPCRKGGIWHTNQVHRILTHSGYHGKWLYNSSSGSIEVGIPSLINEKTFNEVQQLLRKRRICGPGNQKKYEYLLVDYLYCGICKRRMSVVSRILKRKVGSKIYGPYFQQHYYCPGRIQKRGCKMGWIRKDKIESLVWREIEKYIKNPTYIKQIIKASHEKNQDKSVPLKRELIRVASRIEKTELEKEKILRLYREDIVTKNELLSQVEEIRTKRQTLGQQKRQIELKIESEKHLKERLDTLEKIVKKMQKILIT